MGTPQLDIRFVATPFLPEHQPALGVSSLLALLTQHGLSADLRYLNLEYGQEIGWSLSAFLSNGLPTELLIGEFVFARALWGKAAPRWEDYENRLRNSRLRWQQITSLSGDIKGKLEAVRALCEDSPNVVKRWADEILRDAPRAVGLTSTFQQNVASLALAKELRSRVPKEELVILFGGANCESDMGQALADNFPFIDHVVSGEAEGIILPLVQAALDRGAAGTRPARYATGPMIEDMNALPLPNFDDYFNAVQGTEIEPIVNLAAESSRGCWWGAKSHCTFCGLNGGTMTFRSKDPERFAGELRALVRKYGPRFFMMTDNILDLKYLRTLFPALVAAGDEEEMAFFYEIKSNLRKEQVELLAAGGVQRLQPGIESLSTPILKLMGKGTTRFQNLQLLKWAEELHISLAWNLLYGFPGEPQDDYREMADLIPDVVHLPAPTGHGKIRMDRFGPYWKSPATYGIRNLRPYWTYDFAYAGLRAEQRARVAYFFEHDPPEGNDPDAYASDAIAATVAWRSAFRRQATLEIKAEGGDLYVLDSRHDPAGNATPLTSTGRLLLLELDAHQRRDKAVPAVASKAAQSLPAVEALLDQFLERRWVLAEEGQVLSVVLDRSEYQRVLDRRVALKLEALGLGALVAAPAATEKLTILGTRRAAEGI